MIGSFTWSLSRRPIRKLKGNMTYTEKLYCPVCRKATTFVCKDEASGYFCSRCGYRERYKDIESLRGGGGKDRLKTESSP